MISASPTSDHSITSPAMTAQLIETLLWSSTDDDGNELDDREVSEELRDKPEAGFADFMERASWVPGFQGEDHFLGSRTLGSQLEHDYVMTRNHHGVGFWEKSDWEPIYGEALTQICHEMGEIEVYVGDDGLVYG